MAIDLNKLAAFADAFKEAEEDGGGWDWDAIQGIANLAAEALGFTGQELNDLMNQTPDGQTQVIERSPVRIQFTGGDVGLPLPGGFTPSREAHDEAEDAIMIASDHGFDEGTYLILSGAVAITAAHLYNNDNADVDDLSRAWELVNEGLKETTSRPAAR